MKNSLKIVLSLILLQFFYGGIAEILFPSVFLHGQIDFLFCLWAITIPVICLILYFIFIKKIASRLNMTVLEFNTVLFWTWIIIPVVSWFLLICFMIMLYQPFNIVVGLSLAVQAVATIPFIVIFGATLAAIKVHKLSVEIKKKNS